MPPRRETSSARYRQYRQDLAARKTEGSRDSASEHRQSKPKSRRRSFARLFGKFLVLIRPQWLTLVFSLSTVTVATLLGLTQPFAIKIAVDNVLQEGVPLPAMLESTLGPMSRPERLLLIAISMVALATIGISIRMSGRWKTTLMAKRLQARTRRMVFDHAVRLPLHRVHELKSGGVASMLREDAGGVADLLFSMLYNPWRAITMLVGTLIILTIVDLRLLLGSIAVVSLVFLTHWIWIKRLRPLYRDIRASRQAVDGHATEAFGGMRVVRGFGRQRTESNRFTRNNHFMIRQDILAWWWSRVIDIAWAILIPGATAGLLWYGGSQVLDGELTIGDLILFLGYMAMLLEPMAILASNATEFQNSLAGYDRVLDLLEEATEFAANPLARSLDRRAVAGRVTLDEVSFIYPKTAAQVLADIHLDVSPGEMIALVGPSGAGKTTLCNLVARFYDPTTGRVELDGVDLREFDIEQYRRLLGIVEQDIFLFDGTIAENIGYGRRNATLRDIEQAALLANATEFIDRLEKHYDTLIGERGVRLSGGQRQRLAIARAILADPRILILDEATSSLDTESERLIQQSLRTLMSGRTSFVIAHRLSTIAHADRIVVLERGRITEIGSHEELMSRSGRYRQMVELQTAPVAREGDAQQAAAEVPQELAPAG
jgi:ATP-binding cassette subfamily B protein/subfamily B ATP-binding cassette protein MsbA